jgi:hypothetical protein
MRKQRGITLTGTIMWLAILGFLGVMAAKLMPAYLEYGSVKKIFKTMEQSGELKGTVRDIRRTFDKLNAIENVTSVKSEDLEISKQGQETVVSASWSVRVPMVYNVAACLDFTASTGQ